MRELTAFIYLIRPHQWIKNSFVLVGVLFGFKNVQILDWIHAVYAFFAFCLIASTVYIINDIYDVESDRMHPKKCARPIAAGIISAKTALIIVILIIALAAILAIFASVKVFVIVVLYLLINILYTIKLKKLPVLDVFCISSGFMLRLLAGTVGIGISPSKWLLVTGMMITLLLGFGKRRSELTGSSGAEARKSLDQYSIPLLDTYIAVCAGATIISYGLYTVASETIALHDTSNLLWTMPLVMLGIFRYLYLIHHCGKGQDTSKDLLNDLPLLGIVFSWLMLAVITMQFHL